MTKPPREVLRSLRTNFRPGPRDYANRMMLRLRQGFHLPAYLLGGTIDRPIFIIGAPRSGTSILYGVLRASSRLAHWPGEAHEVWEASHHPALRGWTSNVLAASDADDETARRIRRSFFLVTGNRKRLIDKTPRNALRVPFVDAVFPDARYVFLRRDGRDNINSLINAWRTSRYKTYRLPRPHSIPGVDREWWKFVLYPGWTKDASGPLEVVCARQWQLSNECALDAFHGIGARKVDIRYEDLVENASAEVERLVTKLELPYDDSLRRRAEALAATPVNVVTPPERGKWRRENPSEIAAILPMIETTMRRLGYSERNED